MNLTPREKDKLLIAMAAVVARRRLERGVKLNHPEAVAAEPGERLDVGASGFDGMAVARIVSPSPSRLRAALIAAMLALRGREAPRVWN